jgi:hypothetical protein
MERATAEPDRLSLCPQAAGMVEPVRITVARDLAPGRHAERYSVYG